ncbi:hypothetical protein NDU88_000946 [Pleurodeles waltl]|uniref:Uncharacterized protein n=1 Tax=Pleurodeles waltl TaxID=8319 RepID=A0AAV7MKC7_PLEWA|nr:hypothetical protein NDU88_000946 [Pleurodeles waltl]
MVPRGASPGSSLRPSSGRHLEVRQKLRMRLTTGHPGARRHPLTLFYGVAGRSPTGAPPVDTGLRSSPGPPQAPACLGRGRASPSLCGHSILRGSPAAPRLSSKGAVASPARVTLRVFRLATGPQASGLPVPRPGPPLLFAA